MPRDYVKTPRPKDKRGLPGWAWLLAGLLIGLFVALLVYLDKMTPASDKTSITEVIKKHWQEVSSNRKPQAKTPAKNTDETTTISKPKFDFYTILPELEVAIPEQELAPESKSSSDSHKSPPIDYILQAGSFRHYQEADKLKARLALQGIVASIQTVKIGDGDTWHRVRVGPLKDLNSLHQTRRRLQQLGIATIVVKSKS